MVWGCFVYVPLQDNALSGVCPHLIHLIPNSWVRQASELVSRTVLLQRLRRGEGFEEMAAPTAGEQVWCGGGLINNTGCVPI